MHISYDYGLFGITSQKHVCFWQKSIKVALAQTWCQKQIGDSDEYFFPSTFAYTYTPKPEPTKLALRIKKRFHNFIWSYLSSITDNNQEHLPHFGELKNEIASNGTIMYRNSSPIT